ncbi:MAG: response regulator [Desulfosoma sp.]|uniref:response regulator n=1 Tax=Desulfosoma sp. TaxID=2603217 RepID=UPI004049D484
MVREIAEQLGKEASLVIQGHGDARCQGKSGGVGERLRVETQKGRGTRIILDLPVSLATFRGVLIKAAQRKRSVLVAEDSVTSRTLLKNILDAAGYAVSTAVDGREALALLREQALDVVASDVEMPRMNGFELTRTMRQEEKLRHVPVVLVTSLDSREHREQDLEAGADAYIVKSAFDQSTLLDVLVRFTG